MLAERLNGAPFSFSLWSTRSSHAHSRLAEAMAPRAMQDRELFGSGSAEDPPHEDKDTLFAPAAQALAPFFRRFEVAEGAIEQHVIRDLQPC
jgi:hypothetical protein